jgi:hypothetical protein
VLEARPKDERELMANFERHLRRQAARRRTVEMREITDQEAAEASSLAVALTDRVVRSIWEDDDADLDRVVNDGLREVEERFGGAAVVTAFAGATVEVLSHMLSHGELVEDLDEILARVPTLHRPERRKGAFLLAAALVAEAAGMSGRAVAGIEEVFALLHGDAGVIVAGVWQAVTMLGGDLGTGAEWCTAGEEDAASGEPVEVEDAREVAGTVAAVVGLFASGSDALGRAAISSWIEQVVPVDGVLSALAVLDLDGAPDPDAVRAACEQGVEDAEAWEADEETDDSLLARVSRRIEALGSRMSGEEALAVLRRRLGG